jgi:hypothetical protein
MPTMSATHDYLHGIGDNLIPRAILDQLLRKQPFQGESSDDEIRDEQHCFRIPQKTGRIQTYGSHDMILDRFAFACHRYLGRMTKVSHIKSRCCSVSFQKFSLNSLSELTSQFHSKHIWGRSTGDFDAFNFHRVRYVRGSQNFFRGDDVLVGQKPCGRPLESSNKFDDRKVTWSEFCTPSRKPIHELSVTWRLTKCLMIVGI